MAEELKKRQLQ
jgi:hypothetical protein